MASDIKQNKFLQDLLNLLSGSKKEKMDSKSTTAEQTKKAAQQKLRQKKANSLLENLTRPKELVSPSEEGLSKFDRIKKHILLGLAADNIPLDELSISASTAFDDNLIRDPKGSKKTINLLDQAMLASLYESLGAEKMDMLMEDVWEKTDHIYAACPGAIRYKDYNELGERGHELGGMTANYGLQKLGMLGHSLEKAAIKKDDRRIKMLVQHIMPVMQETKAAFHNWRTATEENEELL